MAALKQATTALQTDVQGYRQAMADGQASLGDLEQQVASLSSALEEGANLTPEQLADQLPEWDVRLAELRARYQRLRVPVSSLRAVLWAQFGLLAGLLLVGTPLHLWVFDVTNRAQAVVSIFGWEVAGLTFQLVAVSILAGIWGMGGASIAVITSLTHRFGRGTLTLSYLPAQWTKPLRGAFIGAVIFMLVQGGLIQDNNSTQPPAVPTDAPAGAAADDGAGAGRMPRDLDLVQTFFVLSLSSLAGFQERAFLQKLEDILKAVLGVGGEQEQAAKEGQAPG